MVSAWCLIVSFFISNISRGRTIKQTILGGYVFGVGSTISSFIILGNYGLGLQASGAQDFIAQYNKSGDLYGLIINIVKSMPAGTFILVLIMICMIAFYATSFDSIAYTAACYSYKKLGEDEKPSVMITLLWCLLLIVLPIALVFSESSMNNIQSVSIISAFPIGIIMILMIWSFFKDAKKYMSQQAQPKSVKPKTQKAPPTRQPCGNQRSNGQKILHPKGVIKAFKIHRFILYWKQKKRINR